MQLIIEYEVGDGYTYSCTITEPVVYESAEAFLVDLEDAILNLPEAASHLFQHIEIGGQRFDAHLFYDDGGRISLPDVYTVDEWFSRYITTEEQTCTKK